MSELTKPAAIHWVDGSQEEYEELLPRRWWESGTLIKLNEKFWPGCYYLLPAPMLVMSLELRIALLSALFLRTAQVRQNNWVDPFEMRKYSRGAMRGRTMYVLGL